MKLAPGTPLEIGLLLNDDEPASPVGRLAMAGGLAQLEWSTDVIETQQRIDPLLYPPEPGLQAARGPHFDGLHGFLADSLPDAWGRLLMKRRLEKLGVRLETLTVVDRLALVGNGGRGALVYKPATTPVEDTGAIDLDALAEQSQVLLLGEDTDLIDTLAKLGGASGGARPKVSVGIAADGTVSEDATADGHDEWIVKFRATVDPVEEAYARMARAAGIDMAPSRLLPARDGFGYFATRRFDRPRPAAACTWCRWRARWRRCLTCRASIMMASCARPRRPPATPAMSNRRFAGWSSTSWRTIATIIPGSTAT